MYIQYASGRVWACECVGIDVGRCQREIDPKKYAMRRVRKILGYREK